MKYGFALVAVFVGQTLAFSPFGANKQTPSLSSSSNTSRISSSHTARLNMSSSSSSTPTTTTTTTQKDSLPYGSWPSPITAKFITKSSVGLGSLATDRRGNLFWMEGRSQEGGRQVVCKYQPLHAQAHAERGGVDQVDADANVRTRVHEYGGGAYTLHPTRGGVIYSDFATQRLVWQKDPADPRIPLTPSGPDGQYRFADGRVDPAGRRLICVRENHGPTGDAEPAHVVNEIVSVALDGSGDTRVLATGRDFYQAPRVSPDGKLLAYVTWDHPSMPWDSTELRVASIDGSSSNTDSHVLIDGADGDTSVLQPDWHPATGSLYYISDASGYYNVYRVPPKSVTTTTPGVSLYPQPVDFGGRAPGWVFGQQGYAFLVDGRVAAHYPNTSTGATELVVWAEDTVGVSDVAASTAASARVFGTADGLPHSFSGLTPSITGSLYAVGGGPDVPSGVYKWDGLKKASETTETKAAELLACSSNSKIPDGFVSIPKPVEFPSPLGTSYGYYYPPTNPSATSEEEAPPLLVKVHGGPTACTSAAFNPGIQFFTSRGFAVLDVDYGGSTGYGREYRRRLRGQWGIVDIDDVCAGAEFLTSQKLADPRRLAIDGGSAGGYTTLGALAFRDVFTAGCSLYGVADCSALAADTHKFESRYLDGLIGAWPQEKALYEERAPINSVDKLKCPILLLQGDEDKIVPPNQAELMHAALLEKKIPTALKMYKGEQHGFRKAENIEDALNSELYFYSKVFGFTCYDKDNEIKAFPIDNLKDD